MQPVRAVWAYPSISSTCSRTWSGRGGNGGGGPPFGSRIIPLRPARRRAYDEGVSSPHRRDPAIVPGFSFLRHPFYPDWYTFPQMERLTRPLPLKNAPLQYAPENELGVVFLFSRIAKRLQFRIEAIRAAYPDCIAYRHAGDREKRVRIEFEYRSSSFKAHKHDAKQCDCIVCWHHDWPGVPAHLEVIELKRFFGTPFKIWVQAAIKGQWEYLDSRERLNWALSNRVTHGDLLLMYRAYPNCSITDIFRFTGHGLDERQAGWRDGTCYGGEIKRICRLDAPIFLSDLRQHRVLRTASFVRSNMQGRGGLLVSEYWAYLHSMIHERNPRVRKILARYGPEMV